MKSYKIIDVPVFVDERGALCVMEEGASLPFRPRRVFCIQNVPANEERGHHANINTKFLIVAVRGSVLIHAEDRYGVKDFVLDSPTKGLFLDAMTWKVMKDFSSDAMLLLIADTKYAKADYITKYEEFKERC